MQDYSLYFKNIFQFQYLYSLFIITHLPSFKNPFFSWGLLVCYVSDFSAVCTGEISRLVNDFHEFAIRNVKILGMSCDSIDSHVRWIEVSLKNTLDLNNYNENVLNSRE